MKSLVLGVRIDRVLIDQSIKAGISVTLSSEGTSVTRSLPLDRDVVLELAHLSSNVRVSFTYNDNEIASGYIALPEDCATSSAFEFRDTLVTIVKNLYVENPKFIAEFTVNVTNSTAADRRELENTRQEVFQVTASQFGKARASPLRSTFKGTGKLIPQGETSALRDRINPSHPFHPERTYKYKEEELHGYLKRIVDHHI
jgi:hypothetical protein